jgi:hypothetical protein
VIINSWLVLRTCFWRHKCSKQVLDYDEYRGDFDDLVYDKTNMDWYYPLFYDVYFDDDYIDNDIICNDNNGSDDIINGVLIDNLQIEYKENIEDTQQQKIIDLNYIDSFDYKSIIITKVIYRRIIWI